MFPGLPDAEIKRRTGWLNENMMLGFIAIVCNGNINHIQYSPLTMSWLEEWMFYFEFVWGKSLRRWDDASCKQHYDLDSKQLRIIFDRKLNQVLLCRNSWPRYAKYHEDKKFTSQRWLNKYGDARIIMWDNTNVNLNYMPTLSHAQRLTYSSYYGGNCAKGGVFLQMCGYLGVEKLYTGGISDLDYLKLVDAIATARKGYTIIFNFIQYF